MTTTEPLLRVQDLTASFPAKRRNVLTLDKVSFEVDPGEVIAIVGESGSGKSVTALSIMRLIEREGCRIESGRILFRPKGGDAIDLLRLPEERLRRIRGDAISMIFQDPMTSLNPVLSIAEQLVEVLTLHRGIDRNAARREARDMLDRVRIPEAERRLAQFPHELSGGMRQRVMIAMALLCRPELLIADEPTTALDVTVQAEILALMRELQREIGMAMLFITHDLGVVADIADRVVVMRRGEVVERNAVGSLFAMPGHAYTKALLAAVPKLGEGRGPGDVPDGAPVLSVRGLVKRFPVLHGPFKRLVGQVHAVEGVSFDVGRGETLALVGESGCGKSTTGRTLMKLIEPTLGTITIDGQDVTALSRRAMKPIRSAIQMIFQDPYASLNPQLSIFESVTEPLAIHRPETTRTERRERAASLLARVGLSADHLDRYPHQFSGGQRQRLGIARALCLGPKIIVADEPVSALDVSVQAQVVDLMKDLQREIGVSYLFISHDMGVVERMSHRVAVMYLGQIVEIGSTKAVLHNPGHPYTRRLLASVPIADPTRRRPLLEVASRELPSPMRRLGDEPIVLPLEEVAPGHLVQPSAPVAA